MGRNSTGAWITTECRKLDLRYMLKVGWIKKRCKISGSMSWTDKSTASFESVYTEDEKYLRMIYTVTDRQGIKTNHDYKIELITVPSNLGKGDVLYFECPESYKRARVLYSAYRHHKYLHRDWYKERYGLRLYYPTQQESKRYYNNSRFHNLKKQIEILENELTAKHRKLTYNGKPTKEFLKLKKLIAQRNYHDEKRNVFFMEMYTNF